MKPDYQKAAKKLREAVVDNSHLSVDEIRKKLTDEGVDVRGFLARADGAFRKGLQESIRQKVSRAKAQASVMRGSIFGQIVGKARPDLVALFQAASLGQYGAATRARCRNKNAESMTDEELRSWLEDIERMNREES